MAEAAAISDVAAIAPDVAPTPIPAAEAPVANGVEAAQDVEMKDEVPIVATPTITQPTPTPLPQSAFASNSTSLPPLTSAPAQAQTPSHATPSRNSPLPTPSMAAPERANPHGSNTRVYLNHNVTPYLLEAMKHLATNEPEKPLRYLSEYLREVSERVEGA